MKFCKVSLFFALLVAVCLPAVGQTAMRVDIPFNFIAAGKSLPAGHYKVARSSLPSSCAWYITDDHTSAIMVTSLAEPSQKLHHSSLIFRQAGGTYSLMQIWSQGSGREVPQPKVKQTFVSQVDSKDVKYVEIGAE
jgi:hypothetical protein